MNKHLQSIGLLLLLLCFTLDSIAQIETLNLNITGLGYNIIDEVTGTDDDNLEFLFITNFSDQDVQVAGDSIFKGISFVFPAGTVLLAGETVMLTKDLSKYPDVTMRKFVWTAGKLSNGGEQVAYKTAAGTIINDFTYDDKLPWPEAADGGGFYLQLKADNLDNSLVENWEAKPVILNECTNIGDADGDGVCADVDCNDNDVNISLPGGACDDGNANTENDVVNSNCQCVGTPIVNTAINITGINYNPVVDATLSGSDFEFLLITNYGTQMASVAGDSIKGIGYVFPIGTTIAAGETIMLTKDLDIYPDLDYRRFLWTTGSLSNGGEALLFKKPDNGIVDEVEYDDKAPWPTTADGAGAYLKLKQASLDNTIEENWEAIPLPLTFGACTGVGDTDGDGVCADVDCNDNDATISFPGNACDDGDATTENDVVQSNCQCVGTPIVNASINITGINYNPLVDATLDGDNFEFLLITNYGTQTTSVAGDSIKGISYVFPAGTSIAAGETIMVTKDLTSYPTLDYRRFLFADGKLSNGGEYLLIKRVDNGIVDEVEYDDKAPWPTAADGNGSYLQLKQASLDNTIAENWEAIALPALNDCPDLLANVGEACDDGDATTENDVVQADCSCVGEKIVEPEKMVDLFPNLTFGSTTYKAADKRMMVININEILGGATDGSSIQVFVPFSAGFTYTFDPTQTTATVFALETVNNPDWSVTNTGTGFLFSSNTIIAGGGRSRIAIEINAASAATKSNFTANLVPNSGSETNAQNNISVLAQSIQN